MTPLPLSICLCTSLFSAGDLAIHEEEATHLASQGYGRQGLASSRRGSPLRDGQLRKASLASQHFQGYRTLFWSSLLRHASPDAVLHVEMDAEQADGLAFSFHFHVGGIFSREWVVLFGADQHDVANNFRSMELNFSLCFAQGGRSWRDRVRVCGFAVLLSVGRNVSRIILLLSRICCLFRHRLRVPFCLERVHGHGMCATAWLTLGSLVGHALHRMVRVMPRFSVIRAGLGSRRIFGQEKS